MAEKFLSQEQYVWLKQNYPELLDPEKQRTLVDVIGSYTQRVLELLPDELCPEFTSNGPDVLLQHSEYVGRKVIEVLELETKDIETEKQLGTFFLSEILGNRSGQRIWRSADSERIFEYTLLDHGDTSIRCIYSDTGVRGYLSFSQIVYPFVAALLLYIKSIDPTGETLAKWSWQESFFNGRNFWKWSRLSIIPYEEWGPIWYSLGETLFDSVPTDIKDELYFSLMNKQPCFPVLDSEKKELSFYVRDPEGTIQIGHLWLFRNDFVIKEADVENMFLALCHLVARDPNEILYGIMKYFPEYYQGLVNDKTK